MTARRMVPLLVALLTGCAPAGCDDGKAARQAEKSAREANEKVDRLQETVGGLERRLANLEAGTKAVLGPTPEELGPVMAAIDATGKTPGFFIANYLLLDSDKEGNGVWRLIFGQKDGSGRRVQTRVRKTATGWTWIQGELVLIQ